MLVRGPEYFLQFSLPLVRHEGDPLGGWYLFVRSVEVLPLPLAVR